MAMHRRRGVLFPIAGKRHGTCDRPGAHAGFPLVFQCISNVSLLQLGVRALKPYLCDVEGPGKFVTFDLRVNRDE